MSIRFDVNCHNLKITLIVQKIDSFSLKSSFCFCFFVSHSFLSPFALLKPHLPQTISNHQISFACQNQTNFPSGWGGGGVRAIQWFWPAWPIHATVPPMHLNFHHNCLILLVPKFIVLFNLLSKFHGALWDRTYAYNYDIISDQHMRKKQCPTPQSPMIA